MSEDIKVRVVEFSNRKFYMLQYVDPSTGRKRTKSSKIERTGRKRERTEAERVAAKLEAELREGRYRETSKMTWEEFRSRHETEIQAALSMSSAINFGRTFDWLEKLMRPERVRDVTTDAISQWIAKLREQDTLAITTVGLYCRELRAAMNWAADMGFIPEAPKVRIPKAAKETKPKGRALSLEEHERMLAAAPKVRTGSDVAAWQHLLNGLWWSGLRLREALRLSWDASAPVSVVMRPGFRPALQFQPEGHKGRRRELVPCAPEFAEMLEAVPEERRHGRVFPIGVCEERAGQTLTRIGKKAQIVVNPITRKPASAQDYRRSFGTRWAKRVMPAVLQRLMRHKAIDTTLKFYVAQDVDDMATELWAAYERAGGNTSGNTGQENRLSPREKLPC